ncbi:LOW QUALITY PROTEIN: disintegrin and metalloproteinase domain-containing protein 17 [Elysia marginata]|uniref:Disintegrin and metalloproteinase domain-containing protein 17 n=1 Tax=Elysia marginata TaxID=1093978 RepID=A0AAV4JGU9_9GAST|nr:LOW QUALITY PROTEIN: disintegrin and metalloproteinase domain-containing protein 17 [Elysia marginata]
MRKLPLLTLMALSFTAFQTSFALALSQDSSVLHPNAKATVVDANGNTTSFEIDRSSFFSGIANGNPMFEADAAKVGSSWIIHIHTPQEFYAVEPLTFYDSKANHSHMIAYRGRDIRADNRSHNQPFCQEVSLEETLNVSTYSRQNNNNRKPMVTQKQFLRSRKSNISYGRSVSTQKTNMPYPAAYMQKIEQKNARAKRRKGTLDSESHKFESIMKILQHDRQKYSTQKGTSSFTMSSKRKRSLQPLSSKSRHQNHRSKRFDTRRYLRPVNCDVLSIVDFTLYQGLGAKSETSLIATLVQVYKIVDRVFRNTSFGSKKPGYGIVLAGIQIHKEASKFGYNNGNRRQGPSETLGYMSYRAEFLEYCAAHLNVQRDFGMMLGIATVAAPNSFREGICGTRLPAPAHNILLSTVVDVNGRTLPLKSYSHVVAHEMGALDACHGQSYCSGNSSHDCPLPVALPNKTPCGDQGWCWYGRCESYCEKLGRLKTPARDIRPCQCTQTRAVMCQQCCQYLDIAGPGTRCQVMGGKLKNGSSCAKGVCINGVCENYKVDDQVMTYKYLLPPSDDSPCKLRGSLNVVFLIFMALKSYGFIDW